MNTDLCKQYAELKLLIRNAEDALDEQKRRADALEEQVMQEMLDAGLQNMRLGDGPLLSLRQDCFASMPQGKEVAVALLKDSPWANIVETTVNSNKVSALLRERLENDDVPENWQGVIEPTYKTRVRVTK